LIYLQIEQKSAHSKNMTSPHEFRNTIPGVELESRALKCADGLTRVMVLQPWYWRKLDLLLEAKVHKLNFLTRFCLDYAHDEVAAKGCDFDKAFRELFMYAIWKAFNEYAQAQNGHGNDNHGSFYAD